MASFNRGVSPRVKSKESLMEVEIITGRSGTGKTVYAKKKILEQIRSGKTVLILDVGRSYLDLVQVVHGIHIEVDKDFSAEDIPHFENVLALDFDLMTGENQNFERDVQSTLSRYLTAVDLIVIDESQMFESALQWLSSNAEEWDGALMALSQDKLDITALDTTKATHVSMESPR